MRFREHFELDITGGDEDAARRLRSLVAPFMLRRLKADVLQDLPDKLESVVYVPMEAEQQRLYAAHEQQLRDALNASRFGTRDPREAALELRRIRDELGALRAAAAARPSYRGLVLPALLTVLAAILAAAGAADRQVLFLPAGLLCFLALTAGLSRAAASRRARDAQARLRYELRRLGVESEEQLDASAAEHEEQFSLWKQSSAELDRARRALSLLRQKNRGGGADPLTERLMRVREEMSAVQARLDGLGESAELESELMRLEAALAEDQAQLRSLELARELLAAADSAVQARVSPPLRQRAGELFSRMTGGRYDALDIDRALQLSAREHGAMLGRGSAWLSAGTRGLMYLSLRIALCELALPDGRCPLILDDALALLDDGRARAALDVLYEISGSRQVIIFTCHRREAEYLRPRPGVHITEARK